MNLRACVCFGGDSSIEHPVTSLREARLILREWDADGICGTIVDTWPRGVGVIGQTRRPECRYVHETGTCWLDDALAPDGYLHSRWVGATGPGALRS